ncbi:hypothetical protein [Chryseobacterium phosphatilyticum]|uniref:hypothetical protein n=1 Tax=Chryseobacterium phosphatilyticum TaxID=475075 RepID=UPI001403DD5F|nr:hypothetical protein [Chryseobacterium phosphatilyticum]
MKTSNFKKLNRQEQKGITGSLQIKKCRNGACDPGECCSGGFCLPSPIIECGPILE